ncbi:hypothetical protein MHK_006125 [Candidatus Magnetomorum sp. HK-1]|nr:hypothetical protein MHK_006125 [Candidatus Magnetomorum sp. HK-1]
MNDLLNFDTNKIKKIHLLWIVAMLVFLPSCLNTQSIYPEKQYYLLETTQAPIPEKITSREVLRIAKLRMSPAYTGKGFIYKKNETTYDTDFYNEFLVSPDDMLAEIIRKWFGLTGMFARVTCSSGHYKEKYILEGAVTALHGDYSDRKNPRAVLDIQFFLIEDNGLSYSLILQKNYSKALVIDKHKTHSLVKGWSSALTEILSDFQAEISKKIKKK